jgi:hypothetical protein
MLDTSYGNPFIISVDSGVNTVYLDPDNQVDQAPQLVQVWHEDPIKDNRRDLAKVLQWHIHRNGDDDTYTIRLNPSQENALAYKNNDGNYDGRLWILKYNANSKSQHWHITPINSAVDNTYVISSAENPNYGIIREVDVTTDTYVNVQRMWGGHTPIFAWYIMPAPSDLTKFSEG